MKKFDLHLHLNRTPQPRSSEGFISSYEEMLPHLDELGIEKGVLMSSGEHPPVSFGANEDNRAIAVAMPDRYAWMCNLDGGDPATVYDRLAQYKDQGAVGIGELMLNRRLDDPFLQAVFQAAGELGLPITFHMSLEVGYSYGVVDDPGLPLLEQCLQRFPNTLFLGHSQTFWIEMSGDAPTVKEARNQWGSGPVRPGGRVPELFAKYPNLCGDLSANSAGCAIMRDPAFGVAFLETYADRLFFATDMVNTEMVFPLGAWLDEQAEKRVLTRSAYEKSAGATPSGYSTCERSDSMSKIVQTPCGPVVGTTCQWPGVAAYKGIRYATAGRWEYPVPVTHWEGAYDATQYGACSYQPRSFYDEAQMPEKAFYYNEFRKGEHYDYSEDCLFLNIWTPEDAEPDSALPVIFYIHGGGFTGGCGHEKHFDGPIWPTKGVVAVTINYRLGPVGFVCLPELTAESGRTGNYALYDQLTALQWVHDNIRAFGGDPANITLMGQSAGAMSVQQLVLSPLTEGLAAKAVMSSAGGVNKMFDVRPAADSYGFWQAVMVRAGCADLAAFRALPPEELFAAWKAEQNEHKEMAMSCAPCVDGNLIPCTNTEGAKAGNALNIPYLMGSTSEDIVPPIVFQMAKSWCRLQADQGRQPSYAWFFDRQLPGDDCGAWHSSDLWYWFGTIDHCWRPMTDHDRQLSTQMSDYLTNFAKSGNPNGDGLVEWLPTQKGQNKVLRLGQKTTHMGGVNIAKLKDTMLTKPSVGEQNRGQHRPTCGSDNEINEQGLQAGGNLLSTPVSLLYVKK